MVFFYGGNRWETARVGFGGKLRQKFSKSQITIVAPCQKGFRSTQSVRKLTPFNLHHSKRQQLANETGSESTPNRSNLGSGEVSGTGNCLFRTK